MRNFNDDIFSRAGVIRLAQSLGFGHEPVRLGVACDDYAIVEHLGLRGTLRCLLITTADTTVPNLNRLARRLRAHHSGEPQLYIFATPDYARVAVATFGAEQLATLSLERGRVHAADLDALRELMPQNDEGGLTLALRHARALDRLRVSNRFFADFRAQRALVADAWQGLPARLAVERDQLALLLLCRLMFLYFLQRRGFLCGDPEFFVAALRVHFATPRRSTFYRGVLRPLFFGVLNRRPEQRTRRAAALGSLPYLNGGLFERHLFERRFPQLDLADPLVRGVFEHLLERYRFTAAEGEHELAVDPEMLGRVFEGLMAETTRQNTGTFFTPAPVVDRMVRAAFDAHTSQYAPHHTARVLREVRVLDPACGSGAFLLSALNYITQRRSDAPPDAMRREIVAQNLHGVDVQPDAAMLCALRLWLCLLPDGATQNIQPLPNLDRRIRQGDALVDPLDLASDAVASREVRDARRMLQPLVLRYTTCDPEERQGVHRLLIRRERQLARAWLVALRQRLAHAQRELRAQANARDLFGDVPAAAHQAREQLRAADARAHELHRVQRKLREHGALPFFSFNVHFADADRAGFDIILCNPPWVRSHNWPKHLTVAIRQRFHVCRHGGQVDLALVFLERAISLLAPTGTLAIILPAKFMRSAAGGAARQLLLQKTEIVALEDYSLDQNSIFQADAFAAIVIARRKTAAPSERIAVSMHRRGHSPLRFNAQPAQLPFNADDHRSSWLIAPRSVQAALAHMLENGAPVASRLHIRRGVVTGANSVLIAVHAQGKLGDVAQIRSEGGFEGLIEDSVLHPLVRGADVEAWSADLEHKIIFCHNPDDGAFRAPPKRTARYLREHLSPDARGRLGALQHVGRNVAHSRLAWHDLASTLKAVVLPARAPCLGSARALVPLNTVYYIEAPEDDAHLLAAYFNSLPLRVFARALAERAKDAHFRFFACTVGQLPLPHDWQVKHACELRDLSLRAHADRGIAPEAQTRLDELVADAFALSPPARLALRRFDRWLAGEEA
ncbi:MAG TPA: N-6 DNA methylase [Longimicrobiales bacterium]|nr:N-6 DNA methylase [Longimicrobiales bacterium]